jgi:hypothetical protein
LEVAELRADVEALKKLVSSTVLNADEASRVNRGIDAILSRVDETFAEMRPRPSGNGSGFVEIESAEIMGGRIVRGSVVIAPNDRKMSVEAIRTNEAGALLIDAVDDQRLRKESPEEQANRLGSSIHDQEPGKEGDGPKTTVGRETHVVSSRDVGAMPSGLPDSPPDTVQGSPTLPAGNISEPEAEHPKHKGRHKKGESR